MEHALCTSPASLLMVETGVRRGQREEALVLCSGGKHHSCGIYTPRDQKIFEYEGKSQYVDYAHLLTSNFPSRKLTGISGPN